MLNVTAALENKPIVMSHSVTPHASALQPTKITIDNNYVDQVQVKDTIDVKGLLTSGGTGLGNTLLFHDIYSVKGNGYRPSWNLTTNSDGSFEDQFYFNYPGTYALAYFFHGNNQYAPCRSEVIVITEL